MPQVRLRRAGDAAQRESRSKQTNEDAGGKSGFRLKSGNGQVVAQAEAYESAAKEGCEAVKRAPAEADIEEV